MREVLLYLRERPGWMAGVLYLLLLASIGVVAYLLQTDPAKQRAISGDAPQTEGVWPPPPTDPAQEPGSEHHRADGPEMGISYRFLLGMLVSFAVGWPLAAALRRHAGWPFQQALGLVQFATLSVIGAAQDMRRHTKEAGWIGWMCAAVLLVAALAHDAALRVPYPPPLTLTALLVLCAAWLFWAFSLRTRSATKLTDEED